MDSVRFGRALGIGTRLAAKTVASAVDAARAPNPAAAKSSEPVKTIAPKQQTEAPSSRPFEQKAAQVSAQAVQAGRGVKREGERFGKTVTRLSGVLWLEVTGAFFGLFALTAGTGAWKLRGALMGGGADHDARVKFLVAVGVAVVFGYFCVSSFVSARQRERRR